MSETERTCVRCKQTKELEANFRQSVPDKPGRRRKCNQCLSEEGCERAARKVRERNAQKYVKKFIDRNGDAEARRDRLRQAAAEGIYAGW